MSWGYIDFSCFLCEIINSSQTFKDIYILMHCILFKYVRLCACTDVSYVFVFICVCACVGSTRWGAMPRFRGLCYKHGAMSQACGNKSSFFSFLSHASTLIPSCVPPHPPVMGMWHIVSARCGKTHTCMCKSHQTLRKRMCVLLWGTYVFSRRAQLCVIFLILLTHVVTCCAAGLSPT